VGGKAPQNLQMWMRTAEADMMVAWPLSPHDSTVSLQARLSAVEGALLQGISCCYSLTAAGVAVKLRRAVNMWHKYCVLKHRLWRCSQLLS